MTSIALQNKRKNNFNIVLYLLILVGILLSIEIICKHHATFRHGADAERVRECIKNSREFHVFYNPFTDRYALVCQIENKWGIQIIEKVGDDFEEVTSFIKNKMKRFSQIEKYLRNQGYGR